MTSSTTKRARSERLPREYQAAVQQLQRLLPLVWNHCEPAAALDTADIYEGWYSLFMGLISPKAIPGGEDWKWNQSKSRRDVTIGNLDISMMKVIPRMKRSQDSPVSAPSYKIWMFYIYAGPALSSPLTVIWCERGIPSPYPSLEEYQFLAPLMSQEAVEDLFPDFDPAI